MRRPFLFAFMLLALVSSVVLSSAAILISSPATAQLTANQHRVVLELYDAINAAVMTGDSTLLRAIVANDFVSGDDLQDTESDREDLENLVLDLHHSFPEFRLEVMEIVASGDRAMVNLKIQGQQTDSFLGVPLLASPQPWSSVDLLTVEDGKILERRGLTSGTGQLHAIAQKPLKISGRDQRVVALERVTIPPGLILDFPATLDPQAFAWERGSIRVAMIPSEFLGDDLAPKFEDRLRSYELENEAMLVVPAGHGSTITNHGTGSAILLHFGFVYSVYSQIALGERDPGLSSQNEDIVRQKIVSGVATRLPGDDQQVAAGRISLAPGASLSLDSPAGFALLGLDAGELSVSLDTKGLVRRGSDESWFFVDSAVLSPTDGILIDPGTAIILRNDGSETAQAVMITVVKSPNVT